MEQRPRMRARQVFTVRRGAGWGEPEPVAADLVSPLLRERRLVVPRKASKVTHGEGTRSKTGGAGYGAATELPARLPS